MKFIVLIVAIASLIVGCDRLGDTNIQKEWQGGSQRFLSSRMFASETLMVMSNIIDKTPLERIEREYERICQGTPATFKNVPVEFNGERYDLTLTQALISKYAKEKKTERVLRLIRSSCREYVGNTPIELFLVREMGVDSVELFFEASETCSGDACGRIQTILRRMFFSISIRYADYREFLKVAKAWYLENRTRVKLTQGYGKRDLTKVPVDLFEISN